MSSITHSLNIQDRGIDMEAQNSHTCTGDMVPTYNGIAIPDEVLRQLKMLTSTPISRLTRAELEDAVIGFEGDAQIAEDPNGFTLRDKMRLTWDEEAAKLSQNWAGYDYWPTHTQQYTHTFTKDAKDTAEETTNTEPDSEKPAFSFVERYLNPANYITSISFF